MMLGITVREPKLRAKRRILYVLLSSASARAKLSRSGRNLIHDRSAVRGDARTVFPFTRSHPLLHFISGERPVPLLLARDQLARDISEGSPLVLFRYSKLARAWDAPSRKT